MTDYSFLAYEANNNIPLLGMATMSLIMSTLSIVVLLWMSLSQFRLIRTIKDLEHNTNAIKDQLIESISIISRAEGRLEGIQEEKSRLKPTYTPNHKT
jgi:hypothetical protein